MEEYIYRYLIIYLNTVIFLGICDPWGDGKSFWSYISWNTHCWDTSWVRFHHLRNRMISYKYYIFTFQTRPDAKYATCCPTWVSQNISISVTFLLPTFLFFCSNLSLTSFATCLAWNNLSSVDLAEAVSFSWFKNSQFLFCFCFLGEAVFDRSRVGWEYEKGSSCLCRQGVAACCKSDQDNRTESYI